MSHGFWAGRKPKSNNEKRGKDMILKAQMKGAPVSVSALEAFDCHREASMIGASLLTRVDSTSDNEESN